MAGPGPDISLARTMSTLRRFGPDTEAASAEQVRTRGVSTDRTNRVASGCRLRMIKELTKGFGS